MHDATCMRQATCQQPLPMPTGFETSPPVCTPGDANTLKVPSFYHPPCDSLSHPEAHQKEPSYFPQSGCLLPATGLGLASPPQRSEVGARFQTPFLHVHHPRSSPGYAIRKLLSWSRVRSSSVIPHVPTGLAAVSSGKRNALMLSSPRDGGWVTLHPWVSTNVCWIQPQSPTRSRCYNQPSRK